jgi:hypothetical protein
MAVILAGMVAALFIAIALLPRGISLGQAVSLAGTLGKLNAVDTSLRFDTLYTLWSGLFVGVMVFVSYQPSPPPLSSNLGEFTRMRRAREALEELGAPS